MLKSLLISQYRAFRRLAMDGLTPVTLLVGLNNAGKSSALEAAEVLLAGGRPRSLLWGPMRRDEYVYDSTDDRVPPSRAVAVSHLFYGHTMALGSSFTIEGEDDKRHFVKCEVVHEPDEAEKESRQVKLSLAQQLEEPGEALALLVIGDRGATRIPLSAEGSLAYDAHRRLQPVEVERDAPRDAPPVTFLAADGGINVGGMWDQIVLTPEEQKVVDALKIIEPSIERIAALRQGRYTAGGMMVKVAGSDMRLPLGGMGDGIRHLLSLSVCLANSSGGYLLVDEIDTGLHYTVMEKMWRLVVESAKRLGVQVLASTHSNDCINALACLYSQFPEWRETISLHRIEKGLERTIRYSAEELLAASQQNMEVR